MKKLKLVTSKLKNHYEKKFSTYGQNAKGVDWGSEEKHSLRLREMIRYIIPNLKQGEKILDIGCGYGELVKVIKNEFNIDHINYVGVDPCGNMIKEAINKFPGHEFYGIPFEDFESEFAIENIFSCGLFTKKLDSTNNEMFELMDAFFEKASELNVSTITFNTMSPLCDYQDQELFYPDINIIIELIKKRWGFGIDEFMFGASYLKYEMLVHLKLRNR